jgi:hypothetical protein
MRKMERIVAQCILALCGSHRVSRGGPKRPPDMFGIRGLNALDIALFDSTTHRGLQSGSSPVPAVNS